MIWQVAYSICSRHWNTRIWFRTISGSFHPELQGTSIHIKFFSACDIIWPSLGQGHRRDFGSPFWRSPEPRESLGAWRRILVRFTRPDLPQVFGCFQFQQLMSRLVFEAGYWGSKRARCWAPKIMAMRATQRHGTVRPPIYDFLEMPEDVWLGIYSCWIVMLTFASRVLALSMRVWGDLWPPLFHACLKNMLKCARKVWFQCSKVEEKWNQCTCDFDTFWILCTETENLELWLATRKFST